jgi:hypothetical protein
MTYPAAVPWRIHHRRCDPSPGIDGYWFHANRCGTERHLLAWTAHLLEKDWLKDTDWSVFLYRLLAANGGDLDP